MAQTKINCPSNKPGNKTQFKNRIFSFKFINCLLFIIIIISGGYYLMGINDLSIKGFKIEELKEQKRDFSQANQDLELKIMSLSSYNNISSRVEKLKMIASLDVDYIPGNVDIVAKK